MSWTFDDAPDWLKDMIRQEHTIEALAGAMGKDIREGKATDAEICLALHLASLQAPLRHNPAEIYLYLATRLMEGRGVAVPDDVRVTKLNTDQERELEEYKRTLYHKRGRARSPITDAMQEVFGKPRKRAPEPVKQAPIVSGQQCLIGLFDGVEDLAPVLVDPAPVKKPREVRTMIARVPIDGGEKTLEQCTINERWTTYHVSFVDENGAHMRGTGCDINLAWIAFAQAGKYTWV